jgi:hypothetical protein
MPSSPLSSVVYYHPYLEFQRVRVLPGTVSGAAAAAAERTAGSLAAGWAAG